MEASPVASAPPLREAWEQCPIMDGVRVTITPERAILSWTTFSLVVDRRTLVLSTSLPPQHAPKEAEHQVILAALVAAVHLPEPRHWQVYAVLGLMQLLHATHLVCVSKSACITTIDGKRVCRADLLTLIRVSLGSGSEEGLAEAEEYCRFLAEQFRFYFSPDYDFTQTLQRWSPGVSCDRRFFWNAALAEPFVLAGHGRWILPVTDGFVGVQERTPIDEQWCQYAVISRRGKRRAGTRYLCRGADMRGNVANFVETEQIVSRNGWLSSFVQVRGSIPCLWYITVFVVVVVLYAIVFALCVVTVCGASLSHVFDIGGRQAAARGRTQPAQASTCRALCSGLAVVA
jgi:hypothetical protein